MPYKSDPFPFDRWNPTNARRFALAAESDFRPLRLPSPVAETRAAVAAQKTRYAIRASFNCPLDTERP